MTAIMSREIADGRPEKNRWPIDGDSKLVPLSKNIACEATFSKKRNIGISGEAESVENAVAYDLRNGDRERAYEVPPMQRQADR